MVITNGLIVEKSLFLKIYIFFPISPTKLAPFQQLFNSFVHLCNKSRISFYIARPWKNFLELLLYLANLSSGFELSGLALLSIGIELTTEVDYDKVIDNLL